MALVFRKIPILLLLLSVPLCESGCRKKAEVAPEVEVSVRAEPAGRGDRFRRRSPRMRCWLRSRRQRFPRASALPFARSTCSEAHMVHRGQLLITLDDRDLQGQALESKGSLTSAEGLLRHGNPGHDSGRPAEGRAGCGRDASRCGRCGEDLRATHAGW